ncbi:MAG: phosphatase PAP2 family protein [Fimbriimonas sp.]|nr:phosphatase PAP2 family protein [Fimbriimonas sp.]
MDWLYQWDLSEFRSINIGWSSHWLDPVFMVLSYSGLGLFPTLAPFLFLFGKRTKHYVLPLLITVFVSGVLLADVIKQLIPRDRPSNLAFAIRQEPHLLGSFPSGHTTTSFGFATMLTLMAWNSRFRWIAVSSFLWAILVGFSRIYRGVHWPTDVLAGACLGIGSGCLLYIVLPKVKVRVVETAD